jgi:catechol 2,3-dioxygenase-like lactoylglutathione lyase family enzyme
MELHEVYRGRLIDHIQLIVADLDVSHIFYSTTLDVLEIPVSGKGDGFFWADELVVSTADSEAAQGMLTGRHHLAFQAKSRDMVDLFYKQALAHGGTVHRENVRTIRGTTRHSFWIRMAITLKPSTTVKRSVVQTVCTSLFNLSLPVSGGGVTRGLAGNLVSKTAWLFT